MDGGATQSRCFFDILSTLEPAEDGAEELLESVPGSVEQSITAHLASDVGYTAQLSGGVDSSLVAAIAAKHAERSLVTYGVQLENAAYDEGEYRQMVVDRYNLDHKEIALTGAICVGIAGRCASYGRTGAAWRLRHAETVVPGGAHAVEGCSDR